jgi:BirA family biotin operon repressor/biotin-[acetyl-CoA-carboxylase] ligase
LQNNTFSALFIGQNLVKLSSVASTNNYLKDLVSNSGPLAEGTVIMADHQFAGKGQLQNVWESEAGKNLTISILLKPTFLTVGQQFELNKAVSLALLDVLSPLLGSEVSIKWPNDILVSGKKIAGILIENSVQGSRWKQAVVGIGLNVNQTQFSPNLTRATSIKNVLQTEYNLNSLLADLCMAVERRYLQVRAQKFADLHRDYLQHLFKFGEQSKFRVANELIEAEIMGVSPTGLLELHTSKGTQTVGFKEIAFCFD